jgi:hypothetical protein
VTAPAPLLLLSPAQARVLLAGRPLRPLETSGVLLRLEVGRRSVYRWPDVRDVMEAEGLSRAEAEEFRALVGGLS